MKQEIIDIIRRFYLTNEIKTYDQCAEEILRLFSVGRSEQLPFTKCGEGDNLCNCKKEKDCGYL